MIDDISIKSQVKDHATRSIYDYIRDHGEAGALSERTLMSVFGRGRLFIHKRVKHLKNIGLIKRISLHGERGRFLGSKLIITKTGAVMKNDDHESGKNNVVNFSRLGESVMLSVVQDEHELEKVMYDDPGQCRKAIFFKKECLNDKKCFELYQRLPKSFRDDKSFDDVRKECVSHYGSKTTPLLVCAQRFLTWIKRELNHCLAQDSTGSKLTVFGSKTFYDRYKNNLDHDDTSWTSDLGL